MPNGEMVPDIELCSAEDSFSAFYQEARTNKYVPRAVFVDFEPTVIGKCYFTFTFEIKNQVSDLKAVAPAPVEIFKLASIQN